MPGILEMRQFAAMNSQTVHRWQEAIAYETVYPQIRTEVEATPPVMGGSGRFSDKIYTFAVLCAMGYGSPAAREIILLQLVIDRLDAS